MTTGTIQADLYTLNTLVGEIERISKSLKERCDYDDDAIAIMEIMIEQHISPEDAYKAICMAEMGVIETITLDQHKERFSTGVVLRKNACGEWGDRVTVPITDIVKGDYVYTDNKTFLIV